MRFGVQDKSNFSKDLVHIKDLLKKRGTTKHELGFFLKKTMNWDKNSNEVV